MKNWTKIVMLAVSSPLFCLSAYADELDERWYVAPSLSYIGADNDRRADNDFGLQLGMGRALSERWNIEVSGVIDELEAENNASEFKQGGILVDGLYFFNRVPSFSPYAVVGAGALGTDYANRSSTNPFANIGLGFFHQLTENNIRLRGDVRYRLDDDDDSIPTESSFSDWVVNVGIAIPLGAPPAKVAQVMDSDGDGVPDDMDQCRSTASGTQVDSLGCELDSDGDGVKDSLDSCPQTDQGAEVDSKGCRVASDSDGDGVLDSADECPGTVQGAAVDARGCELDSDGDGVVDRLDQCADTPAGVVVGLDGCEVDSDNDGIVDSQDRCPASAADAKVDIKGCVIPEVLVLKGVNFASGRSEITEESAAVLDEVAASLQKNPGIVVEVAGYTDNSGSRQLNEKLSQQRADAVMTYMVEQGVASANLNAKGYGPADPLADNNTVEGRKKNRRVELHVLSR